LKKSKKRSAVMTIRFPLTLAVVLFASSAVVAEPATNPNSAPTAGGIDSKTAEQPSASQTGASPKNMGDTDHSHIGGMGTKADNDGKGGPN
jgi:hypothetical protein